MKEYRRNHRKTTETTEKILVLCVLKEKHKEKVYGTTRLHKQKNRYR